MCVLHAHLTGAWCIGYERPLGSRENGVLSPVGSHTKDLKIVFAAFAPGARHKRKCEGFCVCVVLHACPLTALNHL